MPPFRQPAAAFLFAAYAFLFLAGCGHNRAGKPADVPPPPLPEAVAEPNDRAQRSIVTAFAVALSRGEGIEQTSLVHPNLMALWAGYGPYRACAAPLVRKLPDPAPEQVEAYLRYRGWRDPRAFRTVRAWAIHDRPCGQATAWGASAVWIAPATGGWRVIRFDTDGDWYAGP